MMLPIFRTRSVRALVATGLLLQMSACASGPEAPLNLPPRQAQWTLHPGNPVIKAGDFRKKETPKK